ncbi:F-box protein At5g07610-like [Rhododendron vialii]|uniref:F-box protein At5g07610-like n=1 Tax=Rhododendron vialii TaxID=182163 RepID=UPI00265E6941|nr:F-box protein At5g07610-like [Rhododendron vialii]
MDASRSSVTTNPIISRASSKISPAAEVIANNVDLLAQILLLLPAKSLIRFKSVSKQWESHISDFRFAAKHSRRNPIPPASGLFLFCKFDKHEHTESVSLQGYPNRPTLDFLDGAGFVLLKAQIAHSCNGLLLCTYRYLVRYRIYSSDHYLVCNPTTKTHALIPDPPAFSSLGFPIALRAFLAFDPSKSPRYKVVFMSLDPDSEKLYSQIDVYCSKRASWKQIRAPGLRLGHVALCGDVLHWLSDEDVLLRFDVDSEMMIETENPLEVISVDKIKYFGECGGRLILIRDHPWSPEMFRIFEMDKDYRGWVMKFWVKLRPLLSKERNISDCSVQCVVKGDKEKDFELVLAFAGKSILSYNLECKTWNVLYDAVPGESISYRNSYVAAYPYIESLSPL